MSSKSMIVVDEASKASPSWWQKLDPLLRRNGRTLEQTCSAQKPKHSSLRPCKSWHPELPVEE